MAFSAAWDSTYQAALGNTPPATPLPEGYQWMFRNGQWVQEPKPDSFLTRLGQTAQGVGETFADAATFGGYTSVAEGLGHDSRSYLEPVINGTPLGAINRKAAEMGAGHYGIPLDLQSPEERASAAAGTGLGGGTGTNFGQDAFHEWGDQAAFTYGEALDASQRAYTPGTIRDVSPIIAPEIRDVQLGDAAQMTASGPARVTGFDAAEVAETGVGPASTAVFEGVERTQFDADPQAEIRARQIGQLDTLTAGARGEGPMAGRATYDAALGRLMDERAALVNQATGEDKAAARLELIQSAGREGLIAARDAAAMDAQAQQSYIQQLSGALQGTRAADVDVSTQIARLDQEANNLEAQLRTAVAQGNAQEINRLTALKANIDAERAQVNAGFVQGARQFRAGAENTAELDYADRLDAASATNVGAINRRTEAQGDLTFRRDVAAGDQSIEAQRITNEQGVDRDVAADTSARSAFDSTTDARLGGLNAANTSTATGIDATRGIVDANRTGYESALDAQDRRDRRDVASREGTRALIQTGIEAYNSYRNRPRTTTSTTQAKPNPF